VRGKGIMLPNYVRMEDALRVFATAAVHQSQEHIRPMHRHVALRLVLEGGFLPDEITPHPPLRATRRRGNWVLEYSPEAETKRELTVLGGMKTKQIDVVVAKRGIGPVLAISIKGTFRAYRNLVNRMEEAIGDSTNVHVMYPGLVYGFLSLARANRESDGYAGNNIGVHQDNTIAPPIMRYHAALSEMTGRRFVRNDYTRYESVGLILVENGPEAPKLINDEFPADSSVLRIESFFPRLFGTYDLRFPARAEHVPITRRVQWAIDSPIFNAIIESNRLPLEDSLDYIPRIAD